MTKKIEVSDEIYDFLMNLSKELKEQDNRCTASPYIFQVRETIEVPAHEGCGDIVWWNSEDEIELRTDEDKIEWIKNNIERFEGYELSNIDKLDYYSLNDLIEDNFFERFYTQKDYRYSNAFLTSKACDEHIRINKHNLHEPVNYLNHAFRNKEFEMLFKFMKEL